MISCSLMTSSQKDLKRTLTTYRFQMSTLSKRFLALERNVQHMVWQCKVYKYFSNSPSVISPLTPLLFHLFCLSCSVQVQIQNSKYSLSSLLDCHNCLNCSSTIAINNQFCPYHKLSGMYNNLSYALTDLPVKQTIRGPSWNNEPKRS